MPTTGALGLGDAHAVLNLLAWKRGSSSQEANQGFHATECFSASAAELDVVQERRAAPANLHRREHRSRPSAGGGHFVLRMRLQARIEDLFDFCMGVEMARPP